METYTAKAHGREIVVDRELMRRERVHLQQGDAGKASLGLKAFRLLLHSIFLLFFRIRVRGTKNIPRRPAIICFNHLGWSEVFVVLLFFPMEPRIYVIGHGHVSELSGFRHWLVDKLQIMIPIDLSKPFQALRTSESLLKRGGSLLISPEGKLGDREGELLPLQLGAAHASVTTGIPLVPVGLTGTKELWLRRTITMRIGKPIYPEHFTGETRERVRAMTTALDRSMRVLLPGDHERARVRLLRRWLTELL